MSVYRVNIMHKNCGYLIPSNKGLYAFHLGNLLNQPIFTMSLRQIRLSELKQSPEPFTRWFSATYFSGKNYTKWDKHRPVFQSGAPAYFQHCRKSWAGQFTQAWYAQIPVHHSVDLCQMNLSELIFKFICTCGQNLTAMHPKG